MKFIKEKIAALESMDLQLDRREKAVNSYIYRLEKGEKNNFKGELFIWDKSGSSKICIATEALFTDEEIITAIKQSMTRIEQKASNIRPVLEMAERALKN